MNINESLRDWIESQIEETSPLADIQIITMGETDDITPPFLGITEVSSEETNDLVPGVSTFQITCELHTVPADESNGGTTPETEREFRRDLYDIIGDEAAIPWMDLKNGWRVFDIRLASPITEASEGRRVSRWNLQIVACPL